MTTVESKLIAFDHKQKAITENLLITSDGQFTEIKKEITLFDGRIQELFTVTDNQGDQLNEHGEMIRLLGDQTGKFEQSLFQIKHLLGWRKQVSFCLSTSILSCQ